MIPPPCRNWGHNKLNVPKEVLGRAGIWTWSVWLQVHCSLVLPQNIKGNTMGSAKRGQDQSEVPSGAWVWTWPGSGTSVSCGSPLPHSWQSSSHTAAPAAPLASAGEPRLVTGNRAWVSWARRLDCGRGKGWLDRMVKGSRTALAIPRPAGRIHRRVFVTCTVLPMPSAQTVCACVWVCKCFSALLILE